MPGLPTIKGPDNPTRQLLPIMSTKCCSGDRERRNDKVVCDKVVYERWSVTKKDGVCVCDKVACERWCVWKCVCEREHVTKLCVKDGVWQSGVWKMVCRKMVWRRGVSNMACQRWWVTKLCVKDGVCVCDEVGWKDSVLKMVWDKVVCERWCVKDGLWWCVKDGVWPSGVKDCVWKMVCERWSVMVCERWCVTKWCVTNPVQACHHSQPSAIRCHKCHACHAKRRWVSPSATPATQNEGGCHQVPRLPRETKKDVAKGNACHAKCRGVTGD